MEKTYSVYKHTAPNGKIYIGITCKPVLKRWLNGKGYKYNKHFWNAIKKYGWENFKHEVLFSCLSSEQASEIERSLIAKYQSNLTDYGYNNTDGGLDGFKCSDESNKAKSKSLKGKIVSDSAKKNMSINHCDCRGKNNPNFGKKWTKEQIQKRQSHRVYARGGEVVSAKSILQFDLQGNFVKRWSCIADAGRTYNKTSIKDCLRGKYTKGCGFVWRYEDERNKTNRN